MGTGVGKELDRMGINQQDSFPEYGAGMTDQNGNISGGIGFLGSLFERGLEKGLAGYLFFLCAIITSK